MHTKRYYQILNIVYIALFTAILSVLSQIAIPSIRGVPMTLQTLAIALTGYVLGSKKGTIVVLLYILLGSIGLPVFASFKAGIGVISGVTGGFIIGFVFQVFLTGFTKSFIKPKNSILNFIYSFLLGLAGLTICHLFGIIQFSLLTKQTFVLSFLLVSAPYLIKDIASVFLAFGLNSILIKTHIISPSIIEWRQLNHGK
jgi:biotin transport system substrate-specific component